MSDFKCQHAGCTEKPVFYIEYERLYMCSHHKDIKYYSFVQTNKIFGGYPNLIKYFGHKVEDLISPDTVISQISKVESQLLNFNKITMKLNNGTMPEESEDLSSKVKNELEDIREQLNIAKDEKKYFEYASLLEEADDIEMTLTEEELYSDAIKA